MEQNIIQNELISTGWIENLAMEEINMDESGVIQFNEHLNPEGSLDESSIKMMDTLRDLFEISLSKFNEYRSHASSTIRIFKISNTVNDFMLFRNSLKLIIARKTNKEIGIGFLSNTNGPFAARIDDSPTTEKQLHTIKAHVGAFNKISWKFEGEPVDSQALIRHYLTEFIRNSAR